MAVTMAAQTTGPGSTVPQRMRSVGGRVVHCYPFSITFDSSYPTAGESMAATIANSPWSVLSTVYLMQMMPTIAPGGTGGFTASDVLYGVPDLTNKKMLLYLNAVAGTDLVQVTDTTNASLITLYGVAYGYR